MGTTRTHATSSHNRSYRKQAPLVPDFVPDNELETTIREICQLFDGTIGLESLRRFDAMGRILAQAINCTDLEIEARIVLNRERLHHYLAPYFRIKTRPNGATSTAELNRWFVAHHYVFKDAAKAF